LQPRPQPRGPPTIVTKTTNIKITTGRINVRVRPPKSRLQPLRGLLATIIKKEEKEDDN
jgi:phage host-nuclease inhibitor protein Gam